MNPPFSNVADGSGLSVKPLTLADDGTGKVLNNAAGGTVGYLQPLGGLNPFASCMPPFNSMYFLNQAAELSHTPQQQQLLIQQLQLQQQQYFLQQQYICSLLQSMQAPRLQQTENDVTPKDVSSSCVTGGGVNPLTGESLKMDANDLLNFSRMMETGIHQRQEIPMRSPVAMVTEPVVPVVKSVAAKEPTKIIVPTVKKAVEHIELGVDSERMSDDDNHRRQLKRKAEQYFDFFIDPTITKADKLSRAHASRVRRRLNKSKAAEPDGNDINEGRYLRRRDSSGRSVGSEGSSHTSSLHSAIVSRRRKAKESRTMSMKSPHDSMSCSLAYCSFVASASADLEKHEKMHSELEDFFCGVEGCDFFCISTKKMEEHRMTLHLVGTL